MNITMKKRRVISLILLVSLIMTPVSAVIIHVTHGREMISHKWLHLHVLFGVVFVIAGVYHVVINWRTLKSYLMGKSK